jgi:hypothetical protein
MLASAPPQSALVSISKEDSNKAVETDYLSWSIGNSGGICAGGDNSTASGFIRNFSAYSESMPFPIVAWAKEGKRKIKSPGRECLDYPARATWAEALNQISTWAGPYNVKTHSGFTEIVWANTADETEIRNSMRKWVPPILFRSRYATDYLKIWHAVSGLDFKYDPAIFTKALEYDRKRLLEESDSDLPISPGDIGDFFPLGFINFKTLEKMAIADFMPKLAAQVGGLARKTHEGWIIEKFQRNEQGMNLIKQCLDHMKSFRGDAADVAMLGRIGNLALPELLSEFNSVKVIRGIDRMGYERRLIKALSRISSPEKDEAFVEALRDFAAGKHRSESMNIDVILEAMMLSNCRAAIPILEVIAANTKLPQDTRTNARIALNANGKPLANEQGFDMSVAPAAKSFLDTEIGTQAMAAIRAVLLQSDHYKQGMEIVSVKNTRGEIVVEGLYAPSSAPDVQSPVSVIRHSWTLTIPVLRADRAFATFGYYCGPWCGRGYQAKLIKQDGRWLVIRWQLVAVM